MSPFGADLFAWDKCPLVQLHVRIYTSFSNPDDAWLAYVGFVAGTSTCRGWILAHFDVVFRWFSLIALPCQSLCDVAVYAAHTQDSWAPHRPKGPHPRPPPGLLGTEKNV